MTENRKTLQLQRDLDAVLARERKAMAALNQAAELVAFSPSLSRLHSREPILAQTGAKARNVLGFHSLAIFLFNEQDHDIELAFSDPDAQRGRLQRELDELIEQGAVAWALNRDQPRFVSATHAPTGARQEMLMHCIATPARVRGIFLGLLAQRRSTLSDIQLPLLSIVLQQGAQMLESFELYNMHRQANLELAGNVRKLKAARSELTAAHDRLEQTVQERTRELERAVQSLEEEARERLHVQQRLQERETTLRALFNATDNLIIMVDGQGRVLTCNDAATRVFGMQDGQLRGKSPWDLMEPQAAEAAFDALKKALRLEQPVYHQHSQAGRDYSVKLYPVTTADGEAVIAMFGHDVTEQRRAEQALRESESRYRSLFEDSPVSLWEEDCSEVKRHFDSLRAQGVIDFAAYFARNPEEVARCAAMIRVVDVNRAALTTHGATCKEQLLQGVAMLFMDQSMECVAEILATLAHGGLSYQGESVNRTLDGRVIDVQVQFNVAPNHEKKLKKVVVSILDVTRRKDMERALLKAKEAAEAASRAKSDFLANMSHEMRTPLNGALGMAQILLDMELEHEQREFVQSIHDNSRRMLDMVNDLLDLSSIGRKRFVLQRRPFCLEESMAPVAAAFEEQCRRKGLAFRMDMDRDIPGVLVGDEGRFKQALVNLLANAVKFTQHGRVGVCIASSKPLRPSPQDENVLWLHCSVVDTGSGISEARLEQVFESFELGESYLTKRHGGAGLGLSIAREIVHKMGGEIWVQSERGAGSTFFFTVPFEQVPADEA